MKHTNKILLLFLAIIYTFNSCTNYNLEDGFGYLAIELNKDNSEDLVFKSSEQEELIFSLKIYNNNNEVVASYDDHNELVNNPLKLMVGTYTAVATSGTSADAAYDSPFYSGSSSFTIVGDQVSNIEINCSLANVKVSASFSDDIANKFTEYTLSVTNGKGSLTFSNLDNTLDRIGYFSVSDELSWSLRLVNKDGQVYESLSDSYTDVKAKQHYNLKFTLGSSDTDFGGGALEVILDDGLTEKNYDLVLDFNDKDIASITENFEYAELIQYPSGDNARKVISVNVPRGCKSLVIDHNISILNSLGNKIELVGATDATISILNQSGIVTNSVISGSTETATIDLTNLASSMQVGTYRMTITTQETKDGQLHYFEKIYNFEVLLASDTDALGATAWAEFAILSARWFTESKPEGIGFQYRKASEQDWTLADMKNIVIDEFSNQYSAEVWGLTSNTEYVFRSISEGDIETREKTFTTSNGGGIHNMTFDSWYKDGKAWYPNLNSSNYVWDSANPGTANLAIGSTVPTYPNSNVAVSGEGKQAAKLETKTAFGVLASGNIYTGKFVKVDGLGAQLDWGVPFSSRPIALRGYYKYTPKNINKVKDPYKNLNGKPDYFQIAVMVTDWAKPFRINTNSGTFVNYDTDPGIIAFGMIDGNTKNDTYVEFTIPLEYRSLTRIPKYVVIVGAASKYGDYFTGGVGSTLELDEFEFVYNPAELTEGERNKVNYR